MAHDEHVARASPDGVVPPEDVRGIDRRVLGVAPPVVDDDVFVRNAARDRNMAHHVGLARKTRRVSPGDDEPRRVPVAKEVARRGHALRERLRRRSIGVHARTQDDDCVRGPAVVRKRNGRDVERGPETRRDHDERRSHPGSRGTLVRQTRRRRRGRCQEHDAEREAEGYGRQSVKPMRSEIPEASRSVREREKPCDQDHRSGDLAKRAAPRRRAKREHRRASREHQHREPLERCERDRRAEPELGDIATGAKECQAHDAEQRDRQQDGRPRRRDDRMRRDATSARKEGPHPTGTPGSSSAFPNEAASA